MHFFRFSQALVDQCSNFTALGQGNYGGYGERERERERERREERAGGGGIEREKIPGELPRVHWLVMISLIGLCLIFTDEALLHPPDSLLRPLCVTVR